MQNQKIASGRGAEVLGRDKKVVASVEVEGAGDRDGERTGSMDGTNGGGDVDSKQVEVARLAVKCQYMGNNDLCGPVGFSMSQPAAR